MPRAFRQTSRAGSLAADSVSSIRSGWRASQWFASPTANPIPTVEKAGDSGEEFRSGFVVSKVDERLGYVFGWGIICKDGGEDYFDLQGHNIPEGILIPAIADFTVNSGILMEMHKGAPRGSAPFSFPLVSDIAAAMGISTQKTGWMVGVKPDEEMLAKFVSGEFTGFSIGGVLIDAEEVEE